MPIYEYKCDNCSFQFEKKQTFSDEPHSKCSKCGHEARRIFSPVPIFFKGPGFYVTDHGSGYSGNCSNTKEESKPASDSDSTTTPSVPAAPVAKSSKEEAAS
jgi:putative FmdB family regulatory protein